MFSIGRSRNASKIIYSAGYTRDPMELYRAFPGREPTIEALLEQRGLTAA
jgi:peptidyl-dipeptidase Dcp